MAQRWPLSSNTLGSGPLILLVPDVTRHDRSNWQLSWLTQCSDCRLIHEPSGRRQSATSFDARLKAIARGNDRPLVIVAEGAACQTVATWATQGADGRAAVIGALFVGPDPHQKACGPLPFASFVVTGSGPPADEGAERLARAWGSGCVATCVPDARAGDWPDGKHLLKQLLARHRRDSPRRDADLAMQDGAMQDRAMQDRARVNAVARSMPPARF